MDWIIKIGSMLILTSISGTLAFGIWKVCAWQMEKRKKLRLIYPMQGIVEFFFLFPLVYLCLELWIHRYGNGMTEGWLFIGTMPMVITCIIFVVIWAAGVLAQLGNYAWKLWNMNDKLQKSCFESERKTRLLAEKVRKNLKLHQKIQVYYSYMAGAPMVTGIVRKRIILPVQEYSEKEMEIILCHEMLHLKQGTLIRKNAGVLIRILHWMNPAAYFLMKELDEWGETACDLAVRYQTNSISDFRMYYHIILKNMEKQNGVPDLMTQFGKMKGIEKRVSRIKNYKREKDFKTTGSVCMMLIFLSVCTTSVCAFGAGFERAYNAVFDSTATEIEDPYQEPEELTEYEEEWNPSEVNVVILPIDGESNLGALTYAEEKNTVLQENTMIKTSDISLKTGNEITVSIVVEPYDKTVKMGIVTPNHKKKYVLVSGSGMHTFDITQDGNYSIFVQNENTVTVEMAGFYQR